MKTVISKFKCGHTRTTILSRGCSKHEEKCLHAETKGKLCPGCAAAENN